MVKRLVVFALLMVISAPAFADYGYHYNKRGTGYWRDDSNDGNPYNNANSLGMNNRNNSGRIYGGGNCSKIYGEC